MKARTSESPSLGASKVLRTESVEARDTPSGPAAATRPFREAMLRSDAVEAGFDSQGEVRRTFASPEMARKPRALRRGYQYPLVAQDNECGVR